MRNTVTQAKLGCKISTIWLFGVLVAAWTALAPPQPAQAQETTATLPLQRYGLGSLQCAAYSPDGMRIVTGGGGGACIWSAGTGEPIRMFSALGHYVQSIAFSPDGTKVLTGGSEDKTARLWNAATGAPICTFTGLKDTVWSVAFSPDGTKVLTGCRTGAPDWLGIATLWDATSGAKIRTFSGNMKNFESVAFSPDGTKILTGSGDIPNGDNTARLWDAATGDILTTFTGHTWVISSVAFSPDGTKVLTGCWDGTAKLWNAATGAEIRTFSGFAVEVYSLAFSPDGTKVLTGGRIGAPDFLGIAELWDAGTGGILTTFTGHTTTVCSVAFSPDGTKALTASRDNTAKLWDASTGTEIRDFEGHTPEVRAVAFSPDGTKVLVGDYEARLWDAVTGARIRIFGVPYRTPPCPVAFSHDGTKVLTGSNSHTPTSGGNIDTCSATSWDATTGGKIRTFEGGHSYWVASAVFSPDDTKVLTGGGGTANLWNAATGAMIRTFSGHTGLVWSVAFSPDGSKVLTGSYDNTAKIWNAATGAVIHTFTGHTNSVNSVAFSPDGTKILTGSSDNTAKLWNASTGAVIRTFSGHTYWVTSVAFSPDGTKVLTGSYDFTAKLWNASTGAVVQSFMGQVGSLSYVAFSPDGSKILTGSDDGSAFVWELQPPRAVIVAGGGDAGGTNPIAAQTNDVAAYAYRVLKARGYKPEDVQYLTSFPAAPGKTVPSGQSAPWRDADDDGQNDVDGWATLDTLRQAITGNFGKGAGRLLILMANHGRPIPAGSTTFDMNETQVLQSSVLDGWLDDLQANPSSAAAPDVTLAVDCCYSGGFRNDCRLTTTELIGGAGWHGSPGHNPANLAGRKRIVITSANDTGACFLDPPDMTCFLYTFLSSAYMGNSMGEAWRAGKLFFDQFEVSVLGQKQTPLLDDGTTTSTPGATSTVRADKDFFGATWAYGVQSTQDINRFFPAFDSWTTSTQATPGSPVTLRAKMLWGQDPLGVTAAIRPPAPTIVTGEPVTSLPRIELRRQSDVASDPLYRVWEVTTSTLFSDKGTYTVSFTARFPYERLSNPEYGSVVVSGGMDPDGVPIRAILAIGSTSDSSLEAALRDLGRYAYDVYCDRFKDIGGHSQPGWVAYLIPSSYDPRSNGLPSAAAAVDAINAVPSDVGRLFVHLAGESNAAGEIALGGGAALTATSLDTALDDLQTRQTCDVILIVDARYSGAFITACKATGTQKRCVLTSGLPTNGAIFYPAPTRMSFSQKFLAYAYQGNDLERSFQSSNQFFKVYSSVRPQRDDNGDGVLKYSGLTPLSEILGDALSGGGSIAPSGAQKDGVFGQTLYLGRRFAYAGGEASGLPYVLDVATTQTKSLGESVTYHARLIEGIEPLIVYAQVSRKDDTGSGVRTSIPQYTMTRDSPTGWTWSATFGAPWQQGEYAIAVYAAYPGSLEEDHLSDPAFSSLTVVLSPLPPAAGRPEWVLYE